ncbi:MAG: hypothetical protein CMI19_04145 [Opitutae bacterium]|nr:hypothetical protein [Opitutae bacterium]
MSCYIRDLFKYLKNFYKLAISPHFDSKFYLKRYDDVRLKRLNPIHHFLTHGWKENRRPSVSFDLQGYIDHYPDVANSGLNPLLHYLNSGIHEGRLTQFNSGGASYSGNSNLAKFLISYEASKEFTFFKNRNFSLPLFNNQTITIIIPIYNAPNELANCLNSLVRNTFSNVRVLLIDDASTDPNIEKIIKDFSTFTNFQYIRNTVNLGYTETVNLGIKNCDGDFVLLNSDTEVTPNWVNRLRNAAYSDPSIGTVTPLSDNAGVFSVPEIDQCNPLPQKFNKDTLAHAFSTDSQYNYLPTPTGNGFCLFIKRKVVNDIGFFDSKKFPRGYGEENDFCLRATGKGWRHIIDDSTIVYHRRTASFGEEKSKLVNEGTSVINKAYPEYKTLVRDFVNSSTLNALRYRIKRLYEDEKLLKHACKKRILYIMHESSGGTPATSLDLARSLETFNTCFFLTSDTKRIRLYLIQDGERVLIRQWTLNSRWRITDFSRDDYKKIIFEILLRYNISLVHVRHLISHTFDAPEIATSLNIPVILSFHDFYFVCPTVNLLDNSSTFCGGTCTSSEGTCNIPLDTNKKIKNLKHSWVKVWRKKVNHLFSYVDAFVTTSQNAKSIILKNYPTLADKNFKIIEHGRDITQKNVDCTIPKGKKKIRILIPGHLDLHKGRDFVRDLINCDKMEKLEFFFMGRTSRDFQNLGKCLGEYKRKDFGKIANKIKPSFIGIFSITCETYCHTITEAWGNGIPVLVSNIGTQKSRLEKHQGGWIIDIEDPKATYKKILEIASDKDNYSKQKSLANLNGIRSVREMTADYDFLYKNVATKCMPFHKNKFKRNISSNVLRIGLFLPAGPFLFNASSYIRILNKLSHSKISNKLSYQIIDIERFLSDPLTSDFDLALIQRNAVPAGKAKTVIQNCKIKKCPILFEIDDNLLDLPLNSKVEFDYRAFRDDVELLVSSAFAVIVSSNNLAERLRPFSNNIKVFPNKIDESLWGLNHNYRPEIKLKNNSVSGVFIGSKTHGEDLNILREPILELLSECKGYFRFYVIGGEEITDSEKWYTPISIPNGFKSYPNFVNWLGKIKNKFDFGVAPLCENALNKSKSYLKYIEYSALGLPGIYSKFGPYPEIVKDGTNGILCENSASEWYDKIKQMIKDSSTREKLIENAYLDVIENHLISKDVDEFLDFLVEVNSEYRLNTSN